MDKDKYWDSLTKEQKNSFWDSMNRADDQGYGDEIIIVDAIDIWELISKDLRGPKPE